MLGIFSKVQMQLLREKGKLCAIMLIIFLSLECHHF